MGVTSAWKLYLTDAQMLFLDLSDYSIILCKIPECFQWSCASNMNIIGHDNTFPQAVSLFKDK